MTPEVATDGRIIARRWETSFGTVRYYINEWPELIGLDVERYQSGSVSSASLKGERISNTQAARLFGIKVWLDTRGYLHVDRVPGLRVMTCEDILEVVAEQVAERGIKKID